MKRTVQSKFFGELEAVRGLACLSVVACHCYLSAAPKWGVSTTEKIAQTVFNITMNAQSVVLLFFVLSGFVLGCLLDRSPIASLGDYGRYMFRRVCRLVPASWISIVFAVAISGIAYSWNELFEAVVFFSFKPNAVLWTMHVELIASAFLPALYVVARKCGVIANFALLIVLSAATLSAAPSFTQYMVFFHTGLLISHVPESWTNKLSPATGFGLVCVSTITMLCLPDILADRSSDAFFGSWHLWLWSEIVPTFIIVYVIVSQKAGMIQSVLNKSATKYFGTISLGIYLFHYHLISIAISVVDSNFVFSENSLGEIWRFSAIYFVTVAAALPLSVLLYTFIERPFIAIGRANWGDGAMQTNRAT